VREESLADQGALLRSPASSRSEVAPSSASFAARLAPEAPEEPRSRAGANFRSDGSSDGIAKRSKQVEARRPATNCGEIGKEDVGLSFPRGVCTNRGGGDSTEAAISQSDSGLPLRGRSKSTTRTHGGRQTVCECMSAPRPGFAKTRRPPTGTPLAAQVKSTAIAGRHQPSIFP